MGDSQGIGFVQYALPEDAERAVAELHGKSLGGRKLQARDPPALCPSALVCISYVLAGMYTSAFCSSLKYCAFPTSPREGVCNLYCQRCLSPLPRCTCPAAWAYPSFSPFHVTDACPLATTKGSETGCSVITPPPHLFNILPVQLPSAAMRMRERLTWLVSRGLRGGWGGARCPMRSAGSPLKSAGKGSRRVENTPPPSQGLQAGPPAPSRARPTGDQGSLPPHQGSHSMVCRESLRTRARCPWQPDMRKPEQRRRRRRRRCSRSL